MRVKSIQPLKGKEDLPVKFTFQSVGCIETKFNNFWDANASRDQHFTTVSKGYIMGSQFVNQFPTTFICQVAPWEHQAIELPLG